MPSRLVKRWVKRLTLVVVVIALTFFAIRSYDSRRGPRLELWHTYVPQELNAQAIDATDWNGYLAAENRIFDEVNMNVTQRLQASERIPINRYFFGSVMYPGHFEHDWNRSYIMMPPGKPRGAVVLLHGLTDTPYSLRHIADNYRQQGFIAIGIRLPAHGTVPGALTRVHWQDWLAATRLAVREAKRLTGPDAPLYLVGFSNGGALAMKYTLDALEDNRLAKPQRVILISPMIGVTSFARFAGLAGLPAIFPPFAKAAWLGIVPEFNPFKYNSFPVNGARQSYLLTNALQEQIALESRKNRLGNLPPILTFQSVVDFTVSTRAVISSLYNMLPDNGSELVLFDINRTADFALLLRSATVSAIQQLLPPPPRPYTASIVTNESVDSSKMVSRTVLAEQSNTTVEPLDMVYPPQLFSLSHVALPFPVTDPLYGSQPEHPEQYGMNLGAMAVRGERSVLIVDLDTLLRASSNPFFPYLLQRIDADIDPPLAKTAAATADQITSKQEFMSPKSLP